MKDIEVQEEQSIELHKLITNILTNMGHKRPTDWMNKLHGDATMVADVNVRRFLINRCFRIILGNCTVEDTIDARYCLVDTGEIKDWLRLFETGVAPLLVRNQLPPAIN